MWATVAKVGSVLLILGAITWYNKYNEERSSKAALEDKLEQLLTWLADLESNRAFLDAQLRRNDAGMRLGRPMTIIDSIVQWSPPLSLPLRSEILANEFACGGVVWQLAVEPLTGPGLTCPGKLFPQVERRSNSSALSAAAQFLRRQLRTRRKTAPAACISIAAAWSPNWRAADRVRLKATLGIGTVSPSGAVSFGLFGDVLDATFTAANPKYYLPVWADERGQLRLTEAPGGATTVLPEAVGGGTGRGGSSGKDGGGKKSRRRGRGPVENLLSLAFRGVTATWHPDSSHQEAQYARALGEQLLLSLVLTDMGLVGNRQLFADSTGRGSPLVRPSVAAPGSLTGGGGGREGAEGPARSVYSWYGRFNTTAPDEILTVLMLDRIMCHGVGISEAIALAMEIMDAYMIITYDPYAPQYSRGIRAVRVGESDSDIAYLNENNKAVLLYLSECTDNDDDSGAPRVMPVARRGSARPLYEPPPWRTGGSGAAARQWLRAKWGLSPPCETCGGQGGAEWDEGLGLSCGDEEGYYEDLYDSYDDVAPWDFDLYGWDEYEVARRTREPVMAAKSLSPYDPNVALYAGNLLWLSQTRLKWEGAPVMSPVGLLRNPVHVAATIGSSPAFMPLELELGAEAAADVWRSFDPRVYFARIAAASNRLDRASRNANTGKMTDDESMPPLVNWQNEFILWHGGDEHRSAVEIARSRIKGMWWLFYVVLALIPLTFQVPLTVLLEGILHVLVVMFGLPVGLTIAVVGLALGFSMTLCRRAAKTTVALGRASAGVLKDILDAVGAALAGPSRRRAIAAAGTASPGGGPSARANAGNGRSAGTGGNGGNGGARAGGGGATFAGHRSAKGARPASGGRRAGGKGLQPGGGGGGGGGSHGDRRRRGGSDAAAGGAAATVAPTVSSAIPPAQPPTHAAPPTSPAVRSASGAGVGTRAASAWRRWWPWAWSREAPESNESTSRGDAANTVEPAGDGAAVASVAEAAAGPAAEAGAQVQDTVTLAAAGADEAAPQAPSADVPPTEAAKHDEHGVAAAAVAAVVTGEVVTGEVVTPAPPAAAGKAVQTPWYTQPTKDSECMDAPAAENTPTPRFGRGPRSGRGRHGGRRGNAAPDRRDGGGGVPASGSDAAGGGGPDFMSSTAAAAAAAAAAAWAHALGAPVARGSRVRELVTQGFGAQGSIAPGSGAQLPVAVAQHINPSRGSVGSIAGQGSDGAVAAAAAGQHGSLDLVRQLLHVGMAPPRAPPAPVVLSPTTAAGTATTTVTVAGPSSGRHAFVSLAPTAAAAEPADDDDDVPIPIPVPAPLPAAAAAMLAPVPVWAAAAPPPPPGPVPMPADEPPIPVPVPVSVWPAAVPTLRSAPVAAADANGHANQQQHHFLSPPAQHPPELQPLQPREDGSRDMCIVCLARRRQVGFLHGRQVHIGICKPCMTTYRQELKARGCPICRQPVDELVEVFD